MRILAIDDDPSVTSLLRRGLSYEGYDVDSSDLFLKPPSNPQLALRCDSTVLLNPVAAHAPGASSHSHGGHDNASTAGHGDAQGAGHTHAAGEAHVETIMTQAEPGVEAGTYTSVLHFDAAGDWQVQLQFNHARAERAGHLALMVVEPPRDWRILGAFGGVNALIIASAGAINLNRTSRTAASTRSPRPRTASAA